MTAQAWWRGWAVRQVVPLLLSHAQRVCAIVERHRRRLLQELQPSSEAGHVKSTPAVAGASAGAGGEHTGASPVSCLHDAGAGMQSGHGKSTATDASAHTPTRTWQGGVEGEWSVCEATAPCYTRGHVQEQLKRKLAVSWSAKRITYPLAQDLRASAPYLSASTDVTVCLCFSASKSGAVFGLHRSVICPYYTISISPFPSKILPRLDEAG